MDSTLLKSQVMDVISSGYAPRYQLRAVFSSGTTKVEAIAVLGKHTSANFASDFTSQIDIRVVLTTAKFMTLFPLRDNLSVTLFQEQVDATSETVAPTGKKYQMNYRAFFTDNEIASVTSTSNGQSTAFSDGKDDLRIFSVQLVDVIAVNMSAKSAQGIFRLTNAFDAMRSYILLKADEDKAAGLAELLALDCVDPDVTGDSAVRDQIIIDHTVKMFHLPNYLQSKEGGIYNHDIGSFIFENKWYTFPLYNTKRFTGTERRLTILQTNSLKLPTADITFRKVGESITIVCAGAVKTQDLSVAGDISGGLGVRFQKSSAFFSDQVVDGADNTAVYNREATTAEIRTSQRADGLAIAPVAADPFTDNLALEQSRISMRNGLLMFTTWQRSDARLLTPGMPVRVYYDNGGTVLTLEGTLLQVVEEWTTEKPGMMQKLQKSAAGLMLFLGKP